MDNKMKTILLMLCFAAVSGCCPGGRIVTGQNGYNYCERPFIDYRYNAEQELKRSEQEKYQREEDRKTIEYQQAALKEYGGTISSATMKKKAADAAEAQKWESEQKIKEEEQQKIANQNMAIFLNDGNKIKNPIKVMAYTGAGLVSILYNTPCELGTAESPMMFKALSIISEVKFVSHGCWGKTLDNQIKLINVWEAPAAVQQSLGTLYWII
jgi:hypothetical protein